MRDTEAEVVETNPGADPEAEPGAAVSRAVAASPAAGGAGDAPEPSPSPSSSPGAAGGEEEALDLAGVGIGPFNLSLAALGQGVPGLRAAFYEQRPDFRWHPGLLIEGATLQVPFLADLVTLADPASPWSFLRFLRERGRLFPFYFAERFHMERTEYDAYCRWVSEGLTGLHFGHRVDAVRWNPERHLFEVDFTRLDGRGEAEARQFVRAQSGAGRRHGAACARAAASAGGVAGGAGHPLGGLSGAP